MLTINYTQLLAETRNYVLHFFESHKDERLVYHNISHTQSVVQAAGLIASHYKLEERESFIVTVAAWFHDLGYFTDVLHHEEKGAALAEVFLKSRGVDAEAITAIKNCIYATRMPQHPQNFLEEIVCDADLFHLGTEDFFRRDKQMRKEATLVSNKKINKADMVKATISFVQKHRYFTDYTRQLLEEKKQENLKEYKKRKLNGSPDEAADANLLQVIKKQLRHEEKNISDGINQHDGPPQKNKKPNRGMDTVFKITSNNNQRLSSQADSKAHIMIQVNSIIISAVLSMLFRRLEEYNYLTIPCILLLSVNVITIIFSVLATRPRLPKGTFDKTDIDNNKVNLLFFGNFYKMPLDDYAAGMLAMLDNSEFLYGSLIRDVYFQGKVLGKKYLLLRISYSVFMYGLIASVLAFIISSVFFAGR